MTSTQPDCPATSYPLSFQSTAASLLSVFARRPLFPITCSLFSENTRGGGGFPAYQPSSAHAKSIAPYHIHVSPAFSGDYALFYTTAQSLLYCFQSFPHSFVVDGGGYPLTLLVPSFEGSLEGIDFREGPKLQRHTVSRPASPSCLEPGLPIHTTLHRTALSGSSSRISSTACPRLNRKFPCSRNPRSEASTTRQGILLWFRSRLMIRLARFLAAIRFKRRPSGTGEVGIFALLAGDRVTAMDTPIDLRRQVISAVRNVKCQRFAGAAQPRREAAARTHGRFVNYGK